MNTYEILETSLNLVSGNRNDTHGDKLRNHQNIADLWSAYLGIEISPTQVATLMVLLKIARTKEGSHNIDDYIDACGYASIAGDLAEQLS